jgi:hypothetical protein
MRWAGHVAHLGRWRDAYIVFMRISGGKIPLVDLGVDGKMILKWHFKKLIGGMDYIHVAEDRGRWRALVNAVMNLRV